MDSAILIVEKSLFVNHANAETNLKIGGCAAFTFSTTVRFRDYLYSKTVELLTPTPEEMNGKRSHCDRC
ncbi:MAG: hypothetical protein BMS9Abin02_0557 [Anaerolineae bacterium]|nr:MAG: hypothetical protein BMS9Abin02_0557 [Anaerolineae bacterium]